MFEIIVRGFSGLVVEEGIRIVVKDWLIDRVHIHVLVMQPVRWVFQESTYVIESVNTLKGEIWHSFR